MESIGTWWMWAAFAAIVGTMLLVDLFAFGGGGKQHRVSLKEAAGWSLAWVTVAMLFAAGLWWYLDGALGRAVANEQTTAFVTGYLVEKSLAVDNVFVWMMIFSFFAVPLELQRRVLLYGHRRRDRAAHDHDLRRQLADQRVPLAVLRLRRLPDRHRHQDGVVSEHDPDLDKNPLIRWIRNHYPITEKPRGRALLRRARRRAHDDATFSPWCWSKSPT